MKFIRIAHKKPDCVGCGLCAEVAPAYFIMDENGEAVLRTIVREDRSFHYAKGFPLDQACLQDAARGCPVGIIRIDP